MKNKFKKYFPWIMVILVTLFYFQYSVTILWDSAHYMNYVNIFEGNLPWNQWDVVRGPIFPIIIYLGNIIFGKTTQGLIMNTYLFYIIMIIFAYKILVTFFDEKKYSKSKKNTITWIIIFTTIILNPIVYGFYHSLLTEFIAITLSVISCYYAFILLEVDFFKNKKKYLYLTGLFILLTLLSWFLKQPYVSCGLFAFLISIIISIFEIRNIKNFIIRISSVIVCILCLVISISCWNKFLTSVGNDPNTERNPTNSLGIQMINAIDFLEVYTSDEIYKKDYIKGTKLSKKEQKDLLISEDKNYVIINIYDGEKIVDVDYILTKDEFGNVSAVDSVIYIIKTFFNKPIDVLNSYLTNYFSIIDIYSTTTTDGVGYESTKKIDLTFSNEISSIAFKPYSYGSSNIFYMTDEMYKRVNCYEQTNFVFKGLNVIMRTLGFIFLAIFKIVFLLMPILFISSIIMRLFFKKNNTYNKQQNLVIILLGFSFLHLLLHTVTGAIIDRYAIPAFITTILGTIMFIKITCSNINIHLNRKNRRK